MNVSWAESTAPIPQPLISLGFPVRADGEPVANLHNGMLMIRGGAMVRRSLALAVLAAVLLVPASAFAISIDQVVSLTRSGVTDAVILAMIQRDRTVFAIEPEQIAALQRAGVSETVILAMLKSGREEGEQAAHADSAYNAAWIASSLAAEPQSISVGHGPDRPNTSNADAFYSAPPAGGFYAAWPWVGRSSRGHADRRSAPHAAAGQQPVTVPPPIAGQPLIGAPAVDLVAAPLCLAQVRGAQSSTTAAYVTACPAAMQTRRR
jgi:hypothetical protein